MPDRFSVLREIKIMYDAARNLLILLLLAMALFSAPASARPDKPNIIIIVTDDQDDGPLFAMPQTKAFLVDGGTRFTNSFVTQSTCAPSRASFLTGQYVHNHGVENLSAESYAVYRQRETETLPV